MCKSLIKHSNQSVAVDPLALHIKTLLGWGAQLRAHAMHGARHHVLSISARLGLGLELFGKAFVDRCSAVVGPAEPFRRPTVRAMLALLARVSARVSISFTNVSARVSISFTNVSLPVCPSVVDRPGAGGGAAPPAGGGCTTAARGGVAPGGSFTTGSLHAGCPSRTPRRVETARSRATSSTRS